MKKKGENLGNEIAPFILESRKLFSKSTHLISPDCQAVGHEGGPR